MMFLTARKLIIAEKFFRSSPWARKFRCRLAQHHFGKEEENEFDAKRFFYCLFPCWIRYLSLSIKSSSSNTLHRLSYLCPSTTFYSQAVKLVSSQAQEANRKRSDGFFHRWSKEKEKLLLLLFISLSLFHFFHELVGCWLVRRTRRKERRKNKSWTGNSLDEREKETRNGSK